MSVVRVANIDDAEQILSIYQPYIEHSVVSFETEVPTCQEMESRISGVLNKHVWLVYEEGEQILGYAYASKHRERAAYRWSVDVSIYIREVSHGQGIGKALYTALLEVLKLQGYCNAFAGICLPNERSVGIHERFGFKKIAHFSKVGNKFGEWYDTGFWQLILKEHEFSPQEPLALSELEPELLRQALIRHKVGTELS